MNVPVRLVVATTEDLDEATRSAIMRVCIEAHDEPDFANLFAWVPSGGLHVVAVRGDDVVGHAMTTTRWLQPEGMPELKTAYVDAVSVSPAVQGTGVGSAVMTRLAEWTAYHTDYVIACLETDKPGFYGRLGWERWRGPKAGRGPHGLVPTPFEQIVMILKLARTPPLNLNGLLTVECQTGRIW